MIKVLGTRLGVIQRRKGKTAGTRSIYGHSGIVYRNRKMIVSTPLEHIVAHHVFLPEKGPDIFTDASVLWDAVAEKEVRKDAVEARCLDVTLPRDLSIECMNSINADIASLFTDLGVPCQADLHTPLAKDGRPNPHTHFLVGERPLAVDGFAKKKSDDLQNLFRDQYGRHLRELVADIINENAKAFGAQDDLVTPHRLLPVPGRPIEPRLPRSVFKEPTKPEHKTKLDALDRTRLLRQTFDYTHAVIDGEENPYEQSAGIGPPVGIEDGFCDVDTTSRDFQIERAEYFAADVEMDDHAQNHEDFEEDRLAELDFEEAAFEEAYESDPGDGWEDLYEHDDAPSPDGF